MSAPTRFKNGVTNVGASDPLNQYGLPDPTLWHTYFNDFDTYLAGEWTVTDVGAGNTQALADGDGGLLLITNDANDNDRSESQKVGESFLLTAGKRTLFKAKFQVSDATQSDFVMGLMVTDTTLMGAVDGAGVTDGVFFSKDDGDVALDIQCQLNATTGQTRDANIHTMVDATDVVVAFYYDGIDRIVYYVDGNQVGALDASSTYLPDTELTVSFGIMNGAAAAKTMTVDYILAAQER